MSAAETAEPEMATTCDGPSPGRSPPVPKSDHRPALFQLDLNRGNARPRRHGEPAPLRVLLDVRITARPPSEPRLAHASEPGRAPRVWQALSQLGASYRTRDLHARVDNGNLGDHATPRAPGPVPPPLPAVPAQSPAPPRSPLHIHRVGRGVGRAAERAAGPGAGRGVGCGVVLSLSTTSPGTGMIRGRSAPASPSTRLAAISPMVFNGSRTVVSGG